MRNVILPTAASDIEPIPNAGIIAPDRARLLQTDRAVGDSSILKADTAVVMPPSATAVYRSIIQ